MWTVEREGEVIARQNEVTGAVVSAAAVSMWSGPVTVKAGGVESVCTRVGGPRNRAAGKEEDWGLYGAAAWAARESGRFIMVDSEGREYVAREEAI